MQPIKYIFSLLAVGLVSLSSSAQASDQSFYSQYQLEIVLGVAVLVCLLALVALITVLFALKAVLRASQPDKATELISVKPGEESVGFWRRFWNRLNDSVPVAHESTILTDHSYDGIRELDNRLPPWWLYGFYFTILFGIVYLLHFHVFKSGDLSQVEYDKEMANAKAEVEAYLASLDNLVDETNVTLAEETTDINAGKEMFIAKCAACHGQLGEGGVGPNFTDKYWLHGGDIQSIFKTIKYGVPSKGMISWQSQLTPKEIQQVASFIYTLEGTDPPNPKDPQGELFERSVGEEDTGQGTVEAGI